MSPNSMCALDTRQFLAQLQGALPYKCTDWYSVKTNPVQISRNLSLCSYLFSDALLHEFQPPQLLQILTSVSSRNSLHSDWVLPPGTLVQKVPLESQDDHRTQLVCFCSFRGQNPLLPIDQCWKSYFMFFASFLVVCSMCREGANSVLLALPWPDHDLL